MCGPVVDIEEAVPAAMRDLGADTAAAAAQRRARVLPDELCEPRRDLCHTWCIHGLSSAPSGRCTAWQCIR